MIVAGWLALFALLAPSTAVASPEVTEGAFLRRGEASPPNLCRARLDGDASPLQGGLHLPRNAPVADGVTVLVTVQGAMARRAASVVAAAAFPAAQGQTYAVVARTPDADWLKIGDGWLPALLGEVSGDVNSLPVIAAPAAPMSTGSRASLPRWIPAITPAMRQRYLSGIRAGRNPRVFTVAGDSNSQWGRYQGRVAAGEFELDAWRGVAARFDPSFTRLSLAVRGGTGAFEMFDPAKASSPVCHADEGMFPCELRVSNASVVFIQLGTGDRFAWREFEANYRRMIDDALAQSVLPVLVTKADDLESWQGGAPMGHMNDTIRRLAQEYGLPLLDFYAATRTLPTVPNPDLPDRPFTQYGLHDEWGYYFHLTDDGYALRILTTLQTLDAISRR